MAKIVVGPINKGLRNDVTPFNIDNDSFPRIINAYQWRGRVKRKRGTSLLSRLTRFFNSTSTSFNAGATTITLDANGEGNILSGFSLQSTATLVPGSVSIVDQTTLIVYTDPAQDGTLSPSGSINYATGEIVILAAANNAVAVQFNYFPGLPVMGFRELALNSAAFPGNIAFDTTYAYNVLNTFPYPNYSVSFYKNPGASASMPGYTPKTTWSPVRWNGQDYQQFWTTNYQNAFWATNGVAVPFSTTNIGMQYGTITNITNIVAGPPATADLNIASHGLSVGDFLFINEVNGVTGINFQTGYVTVVVNANTVTVEFPNATLGGAYVSGGIAQYLTNNSNATKDCIRWYDGDPTDGIVTGPGFVEGRGWVNFCPPLSESVFSIADLPAAQYYLVGAKMIVEFKDRLLFLGPVVQTSAVDSQVYLQDTIIYSQNGTPYYTASFTGDPALATTEFFPILLPPNQTATPTAFWEDQAGFGGFRSAGLQQTLSTVGSNEDVLIIGFTNLEARLVYSGNDLDPFNLFTINSELGSGSTFSAINMDQGVLSRGDRGFIITSQTQSQRFDLEIPDEVFEVKLSNNGTERICAQRDFINEWVYFTYPDDENSYKFPTQTLFYNYRDHSWSIFKEAYTCYGQFKRQSGFTWQTVGFTYPTWSSWNDSWNSGESNLFQPDIVSGNQQGFLILRDEGTNEANSLFIQGFTGNTVTSPDHCLNENDYIVISGCLGTVGDQVNGKIFQVFNTTQNTFELNPAIVAGTYLGGGLIKRMYVPFIQTKQFPTAWGLARKTRLGPQQYLFTTTQNAQITLLIYLSQNASSPYNFPIPDNDSLIYSTILYTCPESTNLGLTPANINLQMVTAQQQSQIWHRKNTSLLGDTVQIGFTMNDDQMRDLTEDGGFISQFAEIELHSFILDVNPSQMLA